MYIAAIDIGSNAIRLAIAHLEVPPYYITYRSRKAVRLGSSVFSEGLISEPIFEDLKSALLQFKNQMENHNVEKLRAIATSAMREAGNNKDVIARLHQQTGIEVEIISGGEEARLVGLAISQKIDTAHGNYLLIDIGGGSIELIAKSEGKTIKKQSFTIGMVRVLELHKKQKLPLEQWLPAFVKNELVDFFEDLPPLTNAVGTGGSMDRFLKLKNFVSQSSDEYLTKKEMKKLYESLTSVGYEERIVKFCLKPDRADVIIPAAIVTNEIMKLADADKLHLPQVGLKDGVLQELSTSISSG